jgi:hypothetical protein
VGERAKTADTDAAPAAPDASAVNAAWRAEAAALGGWRGFVARAFARMLASRFEAQRRFNATQVQLDNELLRYVEERFAATRRRHDLLLSQLGRRQDEIDERHRQLESELLRHVRDLVARIDLVLAEANRDRLALQYALEETRTRLARIEQGLRREG